MRIVGCLVLLGLLWLAAGAVGDANGRARLAEERRREALEAQRRARILMRQVKDLGELSRLATQHVPGFRHAARDDGQRTVRVGRDLEQVEVDGRLTTGQTAAAALPRDPRMAWSRFELHPERTPVAQRVRPEDGSLELSLQEGGSVTQVVLGAVETL